jgi:hypothetical protein
MDEKPFLEFDVTDIKDNQIEELKKFHKSYFDVENIVNTASELKFMNELKSFIHIEFQNPTDGFVRHFAKQAHPGILTAKLMEQFTVLTKKSIQQYINDLITERLKFALKKENSDGQKEMEQEVVLTADTTHENKVEITSEEMEGFMIVKTILRQKIAASRIVFRDAQSYFAILLDDNNRKTICRLYMNTSKKYFAFIDDQKKEVKSEIMTLDDIFNFAETLHTTVANYDATEKKVAHNKAMVPQV